MIEDNKKYLIVKGCAGLGNRLITLCSAIQYAKETNRAILVDWEDGQFDLQGENAFYKYFCLQGIQVIEKLDEILNWNESSKYPQIFGENPKASLYDIYKFISNPLANRIPFFNRYFGGVNKIYNAWMVRESKDDEKQGLTESMKALFDKNSLPLGSRYSKKIKEDIVFYADFCPQFDKLTFLNHIDLKPVFKKAIEKMAEELGLYQNTIGIHIRSTDKKPTKSIDEIDRHIDSLNLKNHCLFLATDNAEVKSYFDKKYGNVLNSGAFLPADMQSGLHQWALYGGNSGRLAGIFKESIIDMWLLSKCEYLLYQGNSSFSTISKTLHKDNNKCIDWQA